MQEQKGQRKQRGELGEHGTTYFGRPAQMTILMCVAILLGATSLTILEIQNDRQNTLADGQRTAQMAVEALEQHTVETFSEATSPMSSFAELLANAGGMNKITPQIAYEWLKALTPEGTPIDRLVLFDERGWLYATSVRPTPPQADMFAKHPVVAPHIAGRTGDRLIIGLPLELPNDTIFLESMTTPGSSRWIIPVTQALHTPNGKVEGVITACFRIDYFKDFYGILGPHRDASIALLRDDGMILARHPFRAEHLGLNASIVIEAFKDASAQSKIPVMRSPLDGIERLYVARNVKGTPLVVVVGLSTENLLHPWYMRAIQRSLALAIFCVIVITLTALLLKGIWRRDNAEKQLQALNLQLEERVRQRTAQLAQVNNDLEALSYSASHDLRAPIRRIRSFAEGIASDHGQVLPPEAARMLARIRHSAAQMDQLLNDLLALFKTNQIPMQPQILNLGEMARSTITEIAADQPQRQYELNIQTEDMEVYADPGLLRVALTNLLSNAWKFSKKTDMTRIVVGRDKGIFYIRDNGAGFDMHHADRLFSPFHRLHNDSEFEGTGIGLAIVQRVIERHEGRIWADAAPNEGATFHFTLNLREA